MGTLSGWPSRDPIWEQDEQRDGAIDTMDAIPPLYPLPTPLAYWGYPVSLWPYPQMGWPDGGLQGLCMGWIQGWDPGSDGQNPGFHGQIDPLHT